MNKPFKDLIVIELAGVLAGPSAGLFFAELGAKVIKIENPKTNGDVTRSWKLSTEDAEQDTSAYYWSVNAGKEVIFLDLTKRLDLEKFYTLIRMADVLITNYKKGDDEKLKVHYRRLSKFNPRLIYASINGFGKDNLRTAYDLILQAESGFMFMNGEKGSKPLKMPVALIDVLAGHQLKEAILIALYNREKTNKGSHITVSLFDSAIASLANQATNWLIAHHLPEAQGSLHPNIAPYGEIFETKDKHHITFAIGSDKQFKHLCDVLKLNKLPEDILFSTNQNRIKNRKKLFELISEKISKTKYQDLFDACLNQDIPIGKIRNLKEVFELPEAQTMLKHFKYKKTNLTSVKSVAFKMS
jgi:crotonobetainyl-CoA:carnitine CoA-transferase CaiB-like acyl-CoA transferase